MVSGVKYARAERELKPARVYGDGALALAEKAELKSDATKPIFVCWRRFIRAEFVISQNFES